MYFKLKKIHETTGKTISDQLREAYYAYYWRDVDESAKEFAWYIPPPTEEELKWIESRHKALMDKLADEIDERIRKVTRLTRKSRAKKPWNLRDQIDFQSIRWPEKTTEQMTDEWNAETEYTIAHPTTEYLARRYLYNMEMILLRMLKQGTIQKISKQFPGLCRPTRWDGHSEYGKFICHYLNRIVAALDKWWQCSLPDPETGAEPEPEPEEDARSKLEEIFGD